MTTIRTHARRALRMLLPGLLSLSAFGASITGTVTDKTTNKPAAGDEVVLIKLAQGMQEAARATTDAKGRFTLDVPDQGMHLVRVTHDKANYFRPAPPGTTSVEVDVYDAAPRVQGIAGEADVIRVQQAENGSAEVIEVYALKNDSNPPKTQLAEHGFEIYLPQNAQITGAAALGPGGMPVQSAPVPLGDKGHYRFDFPLRPGESRFQVTYRLPYNGSLTLAPRVSMPMENVAVLLPKGMGFKQQGTALQPTNDPQTNAQIYVAQNVTPGQTLGFTISGTGTMPQQTQQPASGAAGPEQQGAAEQQAEPQARQANAPGGGLGVPENTPDPLHTYRWWILGGIAVVLGAGTWWVLSRPAAGGEAAAPAGADGAATPPARPADLMAVLKEEIFQLETERLEGRITEGEYRELKAALERVLQHALERRRVVASA